MDWGSLGLSPKTVSRAQIEWIRLRNGNSGPASEMIRTIVELGMDSAPHIRKNYPGLVGWQGIENLREKLSRVLGCEKDKVIFTSNTTDAIRMVLSCLQLTNRDEILTSDLEHDSTLYNCACSNTCWGASVLRVTLSDLVGSHDFELESLNRIKSGVTNRTRLVILSHVAYASGNKLPIKDIVQACKLKNPLTLVLVDGAHSFGLVPLNLAEMMCDFYATSGTKWLCAPEGSGILYIREQLLLNSKILLRPWASSAYQLSERVQSMFENRLNTSGNALINTDDVPRSLEMGTANITSLVGLNSALDQYLIAGPSAILGRIEKLSKSARRILAKTDGVQLTNNSVAVPGIVCFGVKRVSSYKRLCQLVSTLEKEHGVICRAIPEPPCIRLSIHYFNTDADLKQMGDAINQVTSKL